MHKLKIQEPSKRLAAMGLRSFPAKPGAAGAEKFALELFTRLRNRGYQITAYTRTYSGHRKQSPYNYKGIRVIPLKTVSTRGFDTLIHSFKVTIHILRYNTANIVHIQNGGNSFWGLVLRLFGKRVFLSMDGVDWKRDKWPWYGKVYLYFSTFLTARLGSSVIVDNVFTQRWFEKRFHRSFHYIPFGCEVPEDEIEENVLNKFGLTVGEYFIFVGRFIPDKGIHYIISAFEKTDTEKKLMLVGGSPNPSQYEKDIKSTLDSRIMFPGYIYGPEVHSLMKYAYAYIQASDIEGLSPVILEVMALGTPVICSDIQENLFAVEENALIFKRRDTNDLRSKMSDALNNPGRLKCMAEKARASAIKRFSWEQTTVAHVALFEGQDEITTHHDSHDTIEQKH